MSSFLPWVLVVKTGWSSWIASPANKRVVRYNELALAVHFPSYRVPNPLLAWESIDQERGSSYFVGPDSHPRRHRRGTSGNLRAGS